MDYKKEIGLYVIIIFLIYAIYEAASHSIEFGFGSIGRTNLIYLIFVIVALVSIFWKYRFNWIVISLPFFFLFFRRLSLILLSYAQKDSMTLVINGLYLLLSIIAILYLFIKGIAKIKNLVYEIIFGIIILALFLTRFSII